MKTREKAYRGSPVAMVSDHALLRYIERVKGVDVEALREEMLGEGRREAVQKLMSCKLPIGGGAKLIVQQRVVVTVITKEGDPR
jgi:hypothetical protein